LAVVVVVHCFDPTIARLDGVAASEALGREQFVPVRFAVGKSVLQVEVAVAEQTSTVSASEAFRVELLADGVQTVLSKTSSWISSPPGGEEGIRVVSLLP